MALEAETKRVVDQFEVTDVYLNEAVTEFLGQMRKLTCPSSPKQLLALLPSRCS